MLKTVIETPMEQSPPQLESNLKPDSSSTFPLTKLAGNKTYLIGLAGIGVVILGIVVSLILSSQNQDTRKDASVVGGPVKVSISPTTRDLNVNETTTLTVFINTQAKTISGLATRLSYPFASQTPLVTASDPTPLIQQSDPNWQCQVAKTSTTTTAVNIDFGCIYSGQAGYSNDKNIPLFSFTLKAGAITTTSPITIAFDPQQTIVVDKNTGEDIAAIPSGTTVVSVVGQTANTPTPTQSPTPTPTPKIAPAATTTPTPTPTPTVPSSGYSCNHTCTASRDCQTDLTCINSFCRSSKCSSDTSCKCENKDVAKETSTSALPQSGGPPYIVWLSILGGLLIFSSLSFTLFLKTEFDS